MNTKESRKSVLEVMAYLWLIQKNAPDKANKEQKVQQLVDLKSTLNEHADYKRAYRGQLRPEATKK